jgi:hypothetical protein
MNFINSSITEFATTVEVAIAQRCVFEAGWAGLNL